MCASRLERPGLRPGASALSRSKADGAVDLSHCAPAQRKTHGQPSLHTPPLTFTLTCSRRPAPRFAMLGKKGTRRALSEEQSRNDGRLAQIGAGG